ncbi:MAG: hypothetical protein P9E24_09930 [Candidatus Competibacter sp.]|nr:hypothetical protein [Candidatus Competibacter sp.]MDG4585285.1 hypothetical protein [Candidatus Competibacter sp.]
MRLLRRLTGFTELLLLAAMLVGWGGSSDAIRFDGSGGGGFTGGFTGRATITVGMTADKTTLPLNITNAGINPSGPYTNTITVVVKQNGNLFPAPNVAISIVSGLSSGALFYLDGNEEHEDDNGNPLAFRRLTFEDTDGIVTAHFHANSTPGTVVLAATATDPNTGQSISANLTINVTGGGTGGVGGGKPAMVNFVMDPTPVYIRTNPDGTTTVPQRNFKLFQLFVLDDFAQSVSPSGGHMLRIELLPNRPNGGEWLSATDAAGNTQQGATILTDPIGGAATVTLHSGTVPGTVLIAATADRADNNVDNGIQMPITNYASVPIGTGEIKSLTFTGPFADAVNGRWNSLAAQLVDPTTLNPCPDIGPPPDVRCWADVLWDGTFIRYINVIASDPYGNPPPAGTPITFRLIDSPLDMLVNRYPEQGHGQFAITGYNGDPQEGGWEFFAPNRTVSRATGDTLNPFVVPNGVSYALADWPCLLVLQDPEVINPNPSTINALPSEGRLEYHVGSRLITGRAGNMLTVNSPFNQVSQNVGANVWYTVGCPPHKGNVMNFNFVDSPVFGLNEMIVMTDTNGIARTIINYPASQVGRRFMLVAESNGGKVGAVMTHWYLGNPDGSIIAITSPLALAQQMPPLQIACRLEGVDGGTTATLEIMPGATITQAVTLQLLDGGIGNGNCTGPVDPTTPDPPEGVIRTPIPGVPIAVDITINDPSETAAILAEEALVTAQVALDVFVAANPGVCDLILEQGQETPVERDPEKCAKQKELATALENARIAAAQARAIANLHTPTASVVPTTLVTGVGGFVSLVLQVNDLPTDGSVDFLFSTIGPEIRSQTLQIRVQPPQPPQATPTQ